MSQSPNRTTELVDLIVLSYGLFIQEKPDELTWEAALQFIRGVDRMNKHRKKELQIVAKIVSLPVFGRSPSLVYETTKLLADFNLRKLKQGVKDKLVLWLEYFWPDFTPE